MKLAHRKNLQQKRRKHIRKKISGTAERPRLNVRFSHKHIYAQCIDDSAGNTLASVTTTAKDLRDSGLRPNTEGAANAGTKLGEKAQAAGIKQVVFDRGGRRYHGCVKAFADAVREAGLHF